jgi:hypothetical protein
MKSGTRIPPPVHAKIMETNLYEAEIFLLAVAAKTLLPNGTNIDRVE